MYKHIDKIMCIFCSLHVYINWDFYLYRKPTPISLSQDDIFVVKKTHLLFWYLILFCIFDNFRSKERKLGREFVRKTYLFDNLWSFVKSNDLICLCEQVHCEGENSEFNIKYWSTFLFCFCILPSILKKNQDINLI
jgi:hypothetical protein